MRLAAYWGDETPAHMVALAATDAYGGVTIFQAKGYWDNNDRFTIEDSWIVEVYVGREADQNTWLAINQVALDESAYEQAVLVVVNHEAETLTRRPTL